MILRITGLPKTPGLSAEIAGFIHYTWLEMGDACPSIVEFMLTPHTTNNDRLAGFQLVLAYPIDSTTLRSINDTFREPEHALNREPKGHGLKMVRERKIEHNGLIAQYIPDSDVKLEFKPIPGTDQGLLLVMTPGLEAGEGYFFRIAFSRSAIPWRRGHLQTALVNYFDRTALAPATEKTTSGLAEFNVHAQPSLKLAKGGCDFVYFLPPGTRMISREPAAEFHKGDYDHHGRPLQGSPREIWCFRARHWGSDELIDSRACLSGKLDYEMAGPGPAATAKTPRGPARRAVEKQRFLVDWFDESGNRSSTARPDRSVFTQSQVEIKFAKRQKSFALYADETADALRIEAPNRRLVPWHTLRPRERRLFRLFLERLRTGEALPYKTIAREVLGDSAWDEETGETGPIRDLKSSLDLKLGGFLRERFSVHDREYVVKERPTYCWIRSHDSGTGGQP